MIEVVAGVLLRDDKVLIAKRSEGKHLAGYWEFPGGKIEKNESPKISLMREFREELGLEIVVNFLIATHRHEYEEKTINLHGYLVGYVNGAPMTVVHDEIAWVQPNELLTYCLAPADIPIAKEFIRLYLNT